MKGLLSENFLVYHGFCSSCMFYKFISILYLRTCYAAFDSISVIYTELKKSLLAISFHSYFYSSLLRVPSSMS